MCHDPDINLQVAFRDGVHASALLGGETNQYRYCLGRTWDDKLPHVMFLMMNPSTADALTDDRTVSKCVRYARRWGYGSLNVGNVFAYRATDQNELQNVADPVGPCNDHYISEMAGSIDRVIVAHGRLRVAALRGRGPQVVQALRTKGATLCVLRFGNTGIPCHPLYLPAELEPINWPD